MHNVRGLLLAVGLLAVGCEKLPAGLGAPATPPQPPPPQRCNVCSGTGSITQSYEAPLPGQIVECQEQATGFLGLGAEKIATVMVQNNGDEGGTFTVKVVGLYPGGGRIENGSGQVFVKAHGRGTQRVTFRPQPGIQKIECDVQFPKVIQKRTKICPRCNGQGMIIQ